MRKYFGLIPAAGQAIRMRPFRYPKELLPVHFYETNEHGFISPKLLIEYSLEAFSFASIMDVYIVVPDWKPEIMRYLQDGQQFGQHICYLYNSEALGLASSLLSGYPWLNDKATCFAMPDTIFSPPNAFQIIIEKLEEKKADLVLGVFPSDEAHHLAPVEFDEDGRVQNIWEKPSAPKYNNSWGIAVWTEKFWNYFKKRSKTFEPGVSITETFNQAAKDNLNVFCVYFEGGWYKDIGKINNISLMK